MVLKLKEEMTADGLYGIKKKMTQLALHIDGKNEFKEALESKMNA